MHPYVINQTENDLNSGGMSSHSAAREDTYKQPQPAQPRTDVAFEKSKLVIRKLTGIDMQNID